MDEVIRQTGEMRLRPDNPPQAGSPAGRYLHVRSSVAAACALGLVAGLITVGLRDPEATATPDTPAAATDTVTLDGHGIGHGIGLSQWGAYGYAVDLGWTSAQILDQYYGGSVAGTIPTDSAITVRLLALDNRTTTIVSPSGGLVVDGLRGGPYKSVSIRWTGASYLIKARTDREDCTVGEAAWRTPGRLKNQVVVRTRADSLATTNYGDLAGVCQPDGSVRSYRGTILVTQKGTRTVNTVPMEHYLRSVIAKEMSAGWANAGGGRGAQALQAQAVAARSYAFAENRYAPYAKTCDTPSCQVYAGAAIRPALGKAFQRVEYPATDAAVAATAGVVRRMGSVDGPVAYAMFAASSGGYTQRGNGALTAFTPAFDDGDDTPGNPYHNWSVTLTGAQISAAYPAIGTFTGLNVLTRNGLGDWGGRVLTMTVQGSTGSVTISGEAFRSRFGLKSNWFNVRGSIPPDPCVGRGAPAVGTAPTPTAAAFTAVDPVTVVDTQTGTGTQQLALAAGCTLVVDPGLPDGATAALVGITAVSPTSDGALTAYPCATERPGTVSVQAMAGRSVSATSPVTLGVDGTFCIYTTVTAHVSVNLYGYYAPGTGDLFQTMAAGRLYDSRAGAVLAAGSIVHVQVTGKFATPVDATAAAMTVHAFTTGTAGTVTVWPCAASAPTVGSLVATDSVGVTNHVVSRLSATGDICVQVSAPMHIVVDLSGWYGPQATAAYTALAPTRVVDSKTGVGLSGPSAAGANRSFVVAGTGGLPAAGALKGVTAMVGALTPAASGYLTVHPCLPAVPDLSMVRFRAPSAATTAVIAPADASGQWCIASNKATDLTVDVVGYFA